MTEETMESVRHGQPIVATLAGAAVLVAAALAGPLLVPEKPLATLLIAGAVLGLALWAIGFVVTTRHSAICWALGSFAVLLGAGIAAGLVAHGQYQTRARADASSFAEVEWGPDGAPLLPPGVAGRGTLSGLYAAMVQADARDQRELDLAMAKLALGNLNSPYLLQQDGRVIENCGAIAGVKQLAEQQAAQRNARRTALLGALSSATLPARTKSGIEMIADVPDGAALLASQQALLDSSADLCALLARRTWHNNMSYFGFSSGTDAARFKAIKDRQREIAGSMGDAGRAAKERFGQGRELVRDTLSRSIYVGG